MEVSREEYLLHLRREIAMTYNHFYQNYGIENSPNFWTEPIGNISPLDFLKERTDKKIIKTKIIHALAKEYGVIDSFDFEEFKSDWKKYNNDRSKRHEKGNVIYGSINMDIPSYYHYLLTNLEIQVKEKIIREEFSPDNRAMNDFYEQIKYSAFTYFDKIDVETFGFKYNSISYDSAEEEIKKVMKLLNMGYSMNDVSKKYPKGEFSQKVFYDSVPIYGEDNPDEIIKRIATTLSSGEYKIASVQEGIYVVTITNTPIQKIKTFEEVEKEVLYRYQNKKYIELLAYLADNAVLNKHQHNYASISPKDF